MPRSTIFQSILVPLDGSPLAEQAVPLAAGLARRAGSKLRLALVHQRLAAAHNDAAAATSLELAARKSEHAYLHGFADTLRAGGTEVASVVTLSGLTGPSLAAHVQDLGIDLVVMATHGRGGLQRAWLGSVADYLVRSLDVPVLLVRPGEKGAPGLAEPGKGQILVPLDGSPLAEQVLEPATELAKTLDAEMVLLQVVQPVLMGEGMMPTAPSAYDQELTELSREVAQDYVRDVAERLREQGLRASGVAVIGWSVAGSILSAARPGQAAVVALATHGRAGLRRLALGSVADKLVRGADVPVLVYRPSKVTQSKPKPSSPRSSDRRLAAKERG
ncbi:MAG TPA: universal stress protein [Gemmatimonadales bacterium]|jgi:nucleotide-binding universal stress UspA family protein